MSGTRLSAPRSADPQVRRAFEELSRENRTLHARLITLEGRVSATGFPSTASSTYAPRPQSTPSIANEVDAERYGWVSPEDYGATGDGLSDDTLAWQEAIDAAVLGTGAVVCGMGKTYLVGQLEVFSGLTIYGNGSTLLRNNETAPGGRYWTNVLTGLFFASGAITDLTVRDLTIECAHSANAVFLQNGIIFPGNITDCRFENIEFVDVLAGILLADIGIATRVTVNGCRLVGATYYDGVINTYTDGTEWGFKNTTPSGQTLQLPYALFSCYKSSDVLFSNNYAENLMCLVHLSSGGTTASVFHERARILNNTVVNSNDSAIYINGRNHVVENNSVVGSGKDGIKVNTWLASVDTGDDYWSGYCSFLNNRISNPGRLISDGYSGMLLFGKYNVVSGNIFVLDADPISTSQVCISLNCSFTSVTKNTTAISSTVNTYSLIAVNSASYSTVGEANVVADNIFTGGKYGAALTAQTGFGVTGNRFIDQTFKLLTINDSDVTYMRDGRGTIVGNYFRAGYAASVLAELLKVRHTDNVVLSSNLFDGVREYDVTRADRLGCVCGTGNKSVGDPTGSATYGGGQCYPLGPYRNASPIMGTWQVGQAVHGPTDTFYVCTVAGTAGTLNSSATTADLTTGDPVITVSEAAGIYAGVFLTIDSNPYCVKSISGTTVTLYSNALSTGDDLAVAYTAPTFIQSSNYVAP
jgi:hypothetical protein